MSGPPREGGEKAKRSKGPTPRTETCLSSGGVTSGGRVLAPALEGLEARARKDGGLDGAELCRQVWPLIAFAYDIEDAIKHDGPERARMAAALGGRRTLAAVPPTKGPPVTK